MSLYRKYRAQNLDEIIGQDHIMQTLKNALANDRIAHAYLFAGPRGTGKTSVARILAKELGIAPMDTIEIDAASHRGIDEVRALREEVQFQPVAGAKKVYILDEAHMLTRDAFNALLKTLEEPPQFVYFVLCTTEPHKLPITIISRTQRFDFLPGSIEDLKTVLYIILEKEKANLPDDVITLIAKQADGGYRDAVSILEQVLQIPRSANFIEDVQRTLGVVLQQEVDALVRSLLSRDKDTALQQLRAISERGIDSLAFYRSLLLSLRVYLLSSTEGEDLSYIRSLIFSIIQSARNLKYTPVPLLPLELAILEQFSEASNTLPEINENKKSVVPEDTHNTKIKKQVGQQEARTVALKNAEWWPEVLIAIKPHNHTLEALLKGCTPHLTNDSTLILQFKYKFHKERIEEPANKAILIDVIKQVSGASMAVTCVLDESTTVINAKQQDSRTAEVITVDVTARAASKKRSGGNNGSAGTIDGSDDMLEKAMNDLGGKLIE